MSEWQITSTTPIETCFVVRKPVAMYIEKLTCECGQDFERISKSLFDFSKGFKYKCECGNTCTKDKIYPWIQCVEQDSK